MTLTHPLLLAGLALTALPVLLHLILRREPKRLPFPSLRYLRRRHQANRRRLQLRHWLLLALRMLLIALMCLALAKPRLTGSSLALLGDSPVAAVFILDTSPSMEYTAGGKTRLQAARQRLLELLDNLPPESRAAVLDPAEPGGDWSPTLAAARDRIARAEIRADAGPMTEPIAAAYRLFAETTDEASDSGPLPRFLVLASDRTPASWDVQRTSELRDQRDKLEPVPAAIYVDVGVDNPTDLGVVDVELRRQAVPANRPVQVRATVQATGQDFDNQLQFRIDGSPDADTKPAVLQAGQSRVVQFERSGLKPGLYQGEVSLATADAAAFNTSRSLTFEVRQPRRVLILTDRPGRAELMVRSLRMQFECDVRTPGDAELARWSPADLARYSAVLLVSAAAPGRGGSDLWDRLDAYVGQGGALAVFPGGEELDPADYDRPILPVKFAQLVEAPPGEGAKLGYETFAHPMLASFREYAAMPDIDFIRLPPSAYRYWSVVPVAGRSAVLARYNDAENRPAIVEAAFDRNRSRGRVVVFTAPFDGRRDDRGDPWTDYPQTSFFLVITNKAVQYLAGETEDAVLNFMSGPPVVIEVPSAIRAVSFVLQGPGLTASDTQVSRPSGAGELRLPQAREPGNYQLMTADRTWQTGFSVNVPPAESQLLPRVPTETIEELTGPDSVVAASAEVSVRDRIDHRFRQPLELYGWLMIGLLFAFAGEGVMANRFYRRDNESGAEERTRR